MSHVVVVHHSPSPEMHRLLESIMAGLAMPELEGITATSVPALAATSDHVLQADGMVFLTPANFGYMSGALKHFFDTTYYTCVHEVAGRPYALCVHGDDDSTGAIKSVERLAGSWGLTQVAPAVAMHGRASRDDLNNLAETAATVGAHLIE